MQILIIIIIVLLIIYYFKDKTEHAAFGLDGLYLPEDPEQYNILNLKSGYRGILAVKPHLLIDKNDQVKKILFAPPKPGLGETKCYLTTCPVPFSGVYCWNCT
ncbi:hypothetical protein Klosneuvirus_15_11 [Klosneuvirus KNV1]|uniref:Uncharacterized protein n=1 Tax=Klosneuvirus KNV1 TaxID=1977640 RepID=A0A1V0SLT3_9VIRU|nr:hypothetical protein Klosneuvirus_15_11 [Klosneuvirus KNV1]